MDNLTKDNIRSILINQAVKYDKLIKNTYFVVAEKGGCYESIELNFNKKNYLHLSGVNSSLNAAEFYAKCKSKKLANNDFDVRDDLTYKKLEVLPQAMQFAGSSRMKGDFTGARELLQTEAVVGTEKWFLGFVMDKEDKKFYPNTLVKDDIRKECEPKGIVLIFKKGDNAESYGQLEYVAKRYNVETMNNLPRDIKKKIDSSLFCKEMPTADKYRATPAYAEAVQKYGAKEAERLLDETLHPKPNKIDTKKNIRCKSPSKDKTK